LAKNFASHEEYTSSPVLGDNFCLFLTFGHRCVLDWLGVGIRLAVLVLV